MSKLPVSHQTCSPQAPAVMGPLGSRELIAPSSGTNLKNTTWTQSVFMLQEKLVKTCVGWSSFVIINRWFKAVRERDFRPECGHDYISKWPTGQDQLWSQLSWTGQTNDCIYSQTGSLGLNWTDK